LPFELRELIYIVALFPHDEFQALPYQYSKQPRERCEGISTLGPTPFNVSLLGGYN